MIGKHKTKIVEEEGYTKVYYHDTLIVSFNNKEIILDTGGYNTRTTKLRMNQVSETYKLGYHVFAMDNIWYVEHGHAKWILVSNVKSTRRTKKLKLVRW